VITECEVPKVAVCGDVERRTEKAVRVPVWEWVVERDEQGGSAGISGTCHGAMDALTKTLIRAGRPRSGRIRPAVLTRPMHDQPHYLRGLTRYTAVYDGEAIKWS
jgi:hypothetical protein